MSGGCVPAAAAAAAQHSLCRWRKEMKAALGQIGVEGREVRTEEWDRSVWCGMPAGCDC